MPLRILLAVLVALACPTSQAWATGPQFGPMSGGGSGVVANTCTAGDFFSAVDGSGNFTCSTPSGSGDVTAVGDCASGACFTGSSGTTLTGLADTTFQIQSQRSVYVNVDSDNNATTHGFFVGYNGTGTSTTRLFIVQEAGQTELRNGTDLRLYDADDSNYVELAVGAMSSNYALTVPAASGTIAVSATSPITLSAAGAIGVTQNAGTDITADLEEETHATEHSLGGTDPITVTNLASGCTDGQVLGGTAGGTGVECQADVDTNTNASTICAGTTTYLDGEGNCDDISTVYQAADADLTAVAGLSGTGLVARTASNTFTTRSVAEGLAIDVTNGDGVSGNPTVALDPSEFTGAQVWGDGTGTMSWTFNTGTPDTIIDFQAADGVMDITGGLEVNNVPVLTDGTGTVDATNLATDSVSADELNATGVESELEAVLDLNQLQGQIADGQIADGAVDGGSGGEIADGSVTADDLGADSVSASELNATGVESELEAVLDHNDLQGLTTGDPHTQYLALAGRTLSDPGGSVTTIATQTTSSPLAMTNASGFNWLNWDADLTVPNISLSQIFSVNGSLDRTGTTDSLYQFTGFHMATEFTSSTANGPLFQDAFFDASVVNQVANTGTQNTYQPISLLSKPTFKASSGATLTIGQTTGVDINPSWGVAAGGSLTNTTFSAFKLHTPNEIGGTLSLPTYIALDVEDLDTAAVTTPLSLRSVGTTTAMHHAGPARFGATGAPTANFDLDVQGAAKVADYMDVGDDIADLTTNTVNVIDISDTVNMTGNGSLRGIKFAPTHTNSSALAGTLYGLLVEPTVSSDAYDTVAGITMQGTVTQTATASTLAGAAYIMDHATTYTSSVAAVHPRQNVFAIFNHPTLSSSATSGSATMTSNIGLAHQPTISRTGAGTMTVTNDTAVRVTGTYTESAGTLAVTNRRGLHYQEVTNTSSATAITNNIGVDIEALSTATTNIGIRNADTTVYTPTTQAITANSNTIQPAATTVCLTANSNYDLTSNPQIADGVEGQILYLWNCDSAADTIEINDTNGLQLTALFNMDAGDVIVLQYMTIAGASDWYEVSRTED